jgi:8-oxo-dGTP pyrophosphatase MutT (NUDIX family)
MSRRPPLIRDPQAVPVIGHDDHLPAVPADRLSAEAIRARFQRVPDWQPEFLGDGRALLDGVTRHRTPASVLVPLVARDGHLHVLLTRRTDHLHDHAGQVSFPGGRADPEDVDVTATALREAHEEVGLPASAVQVLGTLPVYTTVTSYVVTPVVGLVDPAAPLKVEPFEVDEAFEVPLAFLMDPAHHRRHRFVLGEQAREFLSMPWTGTGHRGLEREYFIWGATAAMLRNFYRFLSA